MKNNTKEVGERSEAQIIAKLLRDGKNVVLLPFGDNQRYDLVLERFENPSCENTCRFESCHLMRSKIGVKIWEK
jgi:hypothetical protein